MLTWKLYLQMRMMDQIALDEEDKEGGDQGDKGEKDEKWGYN